MFEWFGWRSQRWLRARYPATYYLSYDVERDHWVCFVLFETGEKASFRLTRKGLAMAHAEGWAASTRERKWTEEKFNQTGVKKGKI